MPYDLAEQQPDAIATQLSLAATSTGVDPGLGREHRLRGPSPLMAWLLVVIAAVGLLASTPPSAGPDEPVHQVSAWYLSKNWFAPSSPVWFEVPASLWVGPCYYGKPNVSASCMPRRSAIGGTVTVSNVVNYPPFYYWVVGAGERIAAKVGYEYADLGGRLASLALNLGTLLLLTLYMGRRHPLWGSFLLMVSTPMALFMGVTVNPSGWEITCGLVMAAILGEAVWSSRTAGSSSWSRLTLAALGAASIALCLARPLGFVWAGGLTVSAIVLARPMPQRRSLLMLGLAVGPGILAGLLWTLTHPAFGTNNQPYSVLTPQNLVLWFTYSLLAFPDRLRQMFGVLGWLDTPMPGMLYLVSTGAWAVLLTRLPAIGKLAIACGVLGILIAPSAIEALGWATWPAWWQGRYSLPFALGFMLLLLLWSGRFIPRTVLVVAGISLMSLGVMVWVNAIRYAFGLDPSDLPANLTYPAINPLRLGLSAALGAVLVLVSAYQILQAARAKGLSHTEHELPLTSSEVGAG